MSTRIVILGGGFAGLYTALNLQKLTRSDRSIEVTLVSRQNYFLMTPLLFEAGSGVLEPRHAVNPIRPMFGKRTRFVEAEITGVDLDRRVVSTLLVHREPFEIEYDQLILALGGMTNTSLIPGSDTAMTFKTLADAIALRNHVIQCCERAEIGRHDQHKKSLLTFVVIGAGLVGSELMGELHEFLQNVATHYPSVSPEMMRFELIEAGPRIITEMDHELADYAMEVYRRRGINVRVNTKVERIEPGRVTVPGGEVIESETIVVATGVVPTPLLALIAVEKERKGRATVDATMRSASHPSVWALGDCAAVPGPDGKPYPPLAQHAIRQAKVLAGNVVASIRGQPLQPFVYQSLGTLAALGRYKGVGRVLKFRLKGFPAWFVWRTYYLLQMPRWSRRFRIMLDWTVALLFKYDVVQLDLTRTEATVRGEPRNL